MRELDSQAEENRTRTQRNEAVNEFRSLERYANEINQGDEVSKMVDIRIYVTADTQEELEKKWVILDVRSKPWATNPFRILANKPKNGWLSFKVILNNKMNQAVRKA